MSLSTLAKALQRPIYPPGNNQIYDCFILTDSKGNYIKEYCTNNRIRWHCIRGGKLIDLYRWAERNIHLILQSGRPTLLIVWGGTCDLTVKSHRFINFFSGNFDERLESIKTICNKFHEICKSGLLKVTFLVTPPYSIKAWNNSKGHRDTSVFESQDKDLLNAINDLNEVIIKTNHDYGFCSSPNLPSDMRNCRKVKGKTNYYYNFKLLSDGVHPCPTLSQVWMRRIENMINKVCF